MITSNEKPVKAFQPKPAGQPAAKVSARETKQLPEKSLTARAKDSEEFVKITGLFSSVSKTGSKYLTGKDKASGLRYYMFDNKDKKGERQIALMYKGEEQQLVKVAELQERTNKAGKQMFVGEDAEGTSYFIQ